MADFGKLNFSVAFNPTSAFPIDARTMFESYGDALAAAKSAKEAGSTDSVYYYGMVLTVVDPTNKTAKHYIIEAGEETEAGEKEGKLTEIIKISDVVDNLTTADSTKPLSAKQGKEIAEHINEVVDEAVENAISEAQKYTDGEVGKKLDKLDVVDDLETTNPNKALSANQGVVLKNEILKAVSDATVVIEAAVAQAIEEANTYTDEALKEVSIDDSNYAKKSESNSFSLYQTFAGSMPNANTASESTTLIGKSVYVMGAKNASGGWADYSLLNSGYVQLVGEANNQIRISAKGVTPFISANDATNGSREFRFPATAGTFATQEWMEENGGTQLYKHSISVFGGSTLWDEIIIINTSSDNLKDKRAESNFPDLLKGMVAISGRSMGSTQYTILGYIESTFYLSYTEIALIVYDENDSSERIKKISIRSDEIQSDTVTLV